jgi:hypothetical protein
MKNGTVQARRDEWEPQAKRICWRWLQIVSRKTYVAQWAKTEWPWLAKMNVTDYIISTVSC